ncbi:uncharacterized protein LOC127721232 [Mytilus californianus]|uniref:uncharacterized protein LOC127721232 n=1 Tax=Mytilus californianus TaxID=6549 RepID=UPI002247DFA5|nr:uncharacterized protein LOC127721232 [Mytilus californianus]
MTESFINDIKQMFSKHEKRQHIHLDTVYFINGIDEHDVEIQHMTDQVVMFAMQQSSWGQRRPMQWVPLQLQISNMRMKNINIITKKDLLNVNKLNDDLALGEGQLDDFLLVQHSLGKLMYYNRNGLDKFIIIHPPALVNILRSFVTDERFFPAEKDLKSILQTLTDTGKIDKKDLLKLWQQNHLHEYMPDDSIKEFVLKLLIHLDILIIPKANTQTSVYDVYLVPCMIKVSKPFGFNSFDNQIQQTICLRYSLSLHSIPTALAYKVLGAALNAWPLKYKNQKPCLYHKAAVLNVNEENEIRICLEDNRVLISLANQQSLLDISPDVAASIQECLTKNLESSLLFYYNSFGRKMKQTNVSELYTIELGIPCDRYVCFISSQESLTNDKWICDNGKVHETRYLRYWVFNKSQKTCGRECKGLDVNELKTEPSDKHLVRLGGQIGIRSFEEFFINLGMEKNKWENTEYMYAGHSPEGIMSMALNTWKHSRENPSLKDLSDALIAVNLNGHLICQVFREKTKMFEIADFHLQAIPSDLHLKELSNHIGNCPLQLGIELGLSFTDVEQSLFKFQKDLPGLVEDILGKWKRQSKVKTIHSLMMALERVNSGGVRYLRDTSKLS